MHTSLRLSPLFLIAALSSGACRSAAPQGEVPTKAALTSAARPSAAESMTGGLSEEEFKQLHQLPAATTATLKGGPVTIAGATCYLSLPDGASAPLPGVVVIHEWWGLNDHIRLWADRLAAEGYAAIAVDLYDGVVATDRDAAREATRKVDDRRALEIMLAAQRFLKEDPRIRAPRTASIGWCFGGRKSLELALGAPDLDAAVMYYGTPITTPAELAPLKARLLGIFGSRDQSIPPSKLSEFRKGLEVAGKRFEILEYDAGHAFANPSNERYEGDSAARAWEAARAFLKRELRR